MKFNKSIIWVFILLIIVGAVYRVIPWRPFGFAPHFAMALFGGAVIKDKKWAFALPLFSLFISDLLYEILYQNGLSPIKGFYEGQWQNYLWFALITCLGFFMKRISVARVATFSLMAPTIFFLVSNFGVWLGGGGLVRPKSFAGLIQTYVDGLPFYAWGLLATLIFSALLFGGYYLLTKATHRKLAV